MGKCKYTVTQLNRMQEMNLPKEKFEEEFDSSEERDKCFKELERKTVRAIRRDIKNALEEGGIPESVTVGRRIEEWLGSENFTKVITPSFISKDMLSRMSIDSSHELYEQVFWIDKKKCLRPMLAPNLYVMMREMKRISNSPVKIYEIGSCFRKESQGSKHLNEFTMLNCVELATVKEGEQLEELERLAHSSMKALGIEEDQYRFVVEESTVYGHTLDIEINGMEVASGSYGPHKLDEAWGVIDVWVGIGFGIERLTMAMKAGNNIKRFGRSISFFDGYPLNV